MNSNTENSPEPQSARRLASTFRGIFKSSRVYTGISTNALSSLGNFAVSISIARTLPLSEVGEYAIAFSLYVFATGIIRASVCDPLLASTPDKEKFRQGSSRVSLVAIAFSLTMIVFGLGFSMTYLIIMGFCLHGLSLLNYSKTMNITLFEKRYAFSQELIWCVLSLFSGALMIAGVTSGIETFSIWCISGALIGYISALLQKNHLKPRWRLNKHETTNSISFGADYAIMGGASQISFNLVGVFAGLSAVGSLRAGGTLLGPISILIGSAQTFTIPYMARGIPQGPKTALNRAVASTLMISATVLPILAILAFLPNAIGEMLLGANWDITKTVLPYLALEMAFTALSLVPLAGFRALKAGQSAVSIRAFLAVIRIAVVTYAAVTAGMMGAAIAAALTTGLATTIWWIAYTITLRKSYRRSGKTVR